MKHKVTIEFEMQVPDGKQILTCDVLDWMRDRVDDEKLSYTVQTANGETYGAINYRRVSV